MSIDVTLTSYILNPWTNSGNAPIGYHGGTSNLIALSYANLDFTPSASDPYKSTSGDVFKVYVNGVRIYRQSDQDYAGGSGFLEDGDTSGQTLNGVSAAWTDTNNTVWEINTALQLILLNVDGTTGVASTTLYGSGGLNVSFATSDNAPIIELRRAVQDLKSPAIDFSNASILTEQDLDNSAKNVFHVSQQAVISTENAMLYDSGTDTYKATQPGTSNAKRISNVAAPSAGTDAANKSYVDGSNATQTVAGSIANVNAVAGQITPTNNIATVANSAYKTDIETVAEGVYKGKVEIVADSTYKADVETVANSTYKADIETVANSTYKADVQTVGEGVYKGKVETVADNDANVTKVANVDANVTKVANIDSNVTTVANNDANVTKVANIDSDVTTVAGLGTNGAHVTTVATNNANVTTVAQQIADINNFADTYFGSSSSASGPTGTFTAGDLYFSTYNSENKLKVYNGSSWQNATSAVEGVATITEFTPNGSDTHFAFSHDVGLQIVFLNGVRLIQGTDYNSVNSSSSTSNMTSGTASHLHFSTPPASGDVLSAMGFGTVTSTAVVPVSGGTFSGNVAYTGNIQVDDIIEKSADHGVEIDGVLVKDGDVGVATISSKAGTSVGVNLGTDSGDDFNVGSGKLVVKGDTGVVQKNDSYFELRDGSTTYGYIGKGSDLVTGKNAQDLSLRYGLSVGTNTREFHIAEQANPRLTLGVGGDATLHNGSLIFGNAGKGIYLGTTSQTTANLLDDYEEGTYSPAITGSGGSSSGVNFSSRHGAYQKVGNHISVSIHINQTGYTSGPSGTLWVSLPTNAHSTHVGAASIGYTANWNRRPIAGIVAGGTDRLYLYVPDVSSSSNVTAGTAVTNAQASDMQSISEIFCQVTYRMA